MKNLSQEQVVALERAFKKANKGREQIRYEALWLLSRGYRRKEVLTILGISKQALGSWVTQYKNFGLEGLKDKTPPGNHHKLTKNQKDQLEKLITLHTPSQLGLEGEFWTIETLLILVQEKLKVEYESRESYRRLLIFCGFTFHKPKKVNLRQKETDKVRFEEALKKDLKTGMTEKIRWSW